MKKGSTIKKRDSYKEALEAASKIVKEARNKPASNIIQYD